MSLSSPLARLDTASATAERLRPLLLARIPLVTYFILAYLGAWLAWLPVLLDQNGFGLLPVKLPLVPIVALGSFTGPTLAAFVVTGATGGRLAMRRLLRRYVQGRARIRWYALALCLSPLAVLIGCYVALGPAAHEIIAQKLPLFVSAYPLVILTQLLTGPLGEEPGWRGFALPRLQDRFGPLVGSLALGVLWAAWHAPLFLLPAWTGSYNGLVVLAAFASWVVPFTLVMTWLYNNTRGGLVLPILLHAAHNATIGLAVLVLTLPPDLFFQAKVFWPLALLLLLVTRGSLSYRKPLPDAAPCTMQ
jgi:membrane protease YdiL (CAAX protease family)